MSAFRSVCPASGSVAGETLLGEFHEIQNELKTDAYRPYRRLLAEVSLELAHRRGWDLTETGADAIPASIPQWTPFPDTNRSLARLHAAGIRLGILSNIDDDLLEGTLAHFEVPFECLVTAEGLGSYKPASAHFEAGRRWVERERGSERSEPADSPDPPPGGTPVWFHVAQSLFHDIEPATTLGLSTVWVNRKGEVRSPGAWPVHIADDLSGAVDWLLDR